MRAEGVMPRLVDCEDTSDEGEFLPDKSGVRYATVTSTSSSSDAYNLGEIVEYKQQDGEWMKTMLVISKNDDGTYDIAQQSTGEVVYSVYRSDIRHSRESETTLVDNSVERKKRISFKYRSHDSFSSHTQFLEAPYAGIPLFLFNCFLTLDFLLSYNFVSCPLPANSRRIINAHCPMG